MTQVTLRGLVGAKVARTMRFRHGTVSLVSREDSETFTHGLATRILELLSAADRSDLGALAGRLRVSEESLRRTLDTRFPRPTLAVVVAVIREYGVDPTWLLTGEYDTATHRRVIELDRVATIEEIRLLARRRTTPAGIPLWSLLK